MGSRVNQHFGVKRTGEGTGADEQAGAVLPFGEAFHGVVELGAANFDRREGVAEGESRELVRRGRLQRFA